MEQTNEEIDIGSIYDLRDQFREYAKLTPKQYITDKHEERFRRFLLVKRREIAEIYAYALLQYIKTSQWNEFITATVHLHDGVDNTPSVAFTT